MGNLMFSGHTGINHTCAGNNFNFISFLRSDHLFMLNGFDNDLRVTFLSVCDIDIYIFIYTYIYIYISISIYIYISLSLYIYIYIYKDIDI